MEMEDLVGSLNISKFQISPLKINKLQSELLNGRPLAYMQGFCEFYQHRFFVNEDVLIPRPETELLVDMIVKEKRTFEKVLDIGVGSGVIVLSLLSLAKVKSGLGVDISPSALVTARTNARRLRLENRCELRLSDRLNKVSEKFDLIVSNPPYIKESAHRRLVHKNVDEHEPHEALYLSDFEYEKWFYLLFSQVKSALLPHGVFYMEGHEEELQHQAKMLKDLKFSEVKVLQDFSQRDRFIKALP